MKTLLITLDFWPKTGGVARYYFDLCKKMGSGVAVLTDLERSLFATNKPETRNQKPEIINSNIGSSELGEAQAKPVRNFFDKEHEKNLPFKIYRRKLLSKFVWPRWFAMFLSARQVMRKEKPDIIWAGEVIPTGTVVRVLARSFHIPYFVSCHGNDLLRAQKKPRKFWLARQILKNAKYVRVNSKFTGGLLREFGVEKKNIQVVYPEVNHENIKSLKHENQELDPNKNTRGQLIDKYNLRGRKILFSMGRLVYRKGFDLVIKSLPEVWKKIPDLVYVLAGDGEARAHLEELSHKVSQDKIILLGKITDEEKWAWLDLCDAFIMTPRRSKDDIEGFGIVYLEADAAGKPVIGSNVGGVPEAIQKCGQGILVNDPEDEQEMSKQIRWALLKGATRRN